MNAEPTGPPQREEAERSVLGTVLLAPSTLAQLLGVERLRPEHFYRPRNSAIFSAAIALHDRGDAIDPVTVVGELKRSGQIEQVDEAYVHSLPAVVPSISSWQTYARDVIEDARFRSELAAAYEIVDAAQQRDRGRVVDALSALEQAEVSDADRPSLKDRQEQLVEHLEHGEEEKWPYPVPRLNRLTFGGMRRGQLTILGGQRSHGKSVIVDQFLESAAKHGAKVALYLNEDSVQERDLRTISRSAGIDFARVMAGEVRDGEQPRFVRAVRELPFEVIPAHGWTAQEIDYDIRANGWDVVGLDLLNLLPGRETSDIDDNVRLLRSTCGERRANCHLIACQHLNRFRDTGSYPPEPTLRDIRGSGAIADLATNVLFVYRHQEEDLAGQLQGRPGNRTLLKIDKAKNGILGEAELYFDGSRMRFTEALNEEPVAA